MELSNDVRVKKVLTEEEKQKRRDYNRAYMAKRRLEPEFLAKQQEYCRVIFNCKNRGKKIFW